MNDIYENCSIFKIEDLYIVIEKAPSGNAHDPSGCISVLFPIISILFVDYFY